MTVPALMVLITSSCVAWECRSTSVNNEDVQILAKVTKVATDCELHGPVVSLYCPFLPGIVRRG